MPLPEKSLEIRREIGLVPDDSLLFDYLTGAEYLEFVGRLYGLPKPQAKERGGELLQLFQLAENARKLIGEYSKGMRKRIAMAAALIHRPKLFLMDEPFEGVDAVGARLMKDILLEQVQHGATVFLTSHVLEVVERLCDQVAIINRGKIVTQGTMADLRSQSANRRQFARRHFRQHRWRRALFRKTRLVIALMTQQILAIVWAQFRITRNHLPRTTVGAVSMWILHCLFGIPCLLVSPSWPSSAFRHLRMQTCAKPCPSRLLAFFLYNQTIPLLTLSTGWSLQINKLQVYPIRDSALFGLEVLLRITSAPEFMVVLLGGVIGLARRSDVPLPRRALPVALYPAQSVSAISRARLCYSRL